MSISIAPMILLLLLATLGALIWWLARPPKLSEAGKLVFFAAVLALAFLIAGGQPLRL